MVYHTVLLYYYYRNDIWSMLELWGLMYPNVNTRNMHICNLCRAQNQCNTMRSMRNQFENQNKCKWKKENVITFRKCNKYLIQWRVKNFKSVHSVGERSVTKSPSFERLMLYGLLVSTVCTYTYYYCNAYLFIYLYYTSSSLYITNLSVALQALSIITTYIHCTYTHIMNQHTNMIVFGP